MLTLIPDYQFTACGHQTTWNNDKHGLLNNFVYLHGKAESLAGFDILFRQVEDDKSPIPLEGDFGTKAVFVHFHTAKMNEVKPCVMVWRIAPAKDGYSARLHALVCLSDDVDGLADAISHMPRCENPPSRPLEARWFSISAHWHNASEQKTKTKTK